MSHTVTVRLNIVKSNILYYYTVRLMILSSDQTYSDLGYCHVVQCYNIFKRYYHVVTTNGIT